MYDSKLKQREWLRQDYKKRPEYYRRKSALTRYKRESSIRHLINFEKSKPCLDCSGWFDPCQMQFDHRNPETKEFCIGRAISTLMPTFRIIAEIKKCDLVCANCHALRTFNQHKEGLFHVERKYK